MAHRKAVEGWFERRKAAERFCELHKGHRIISGVKSGFIVIRQVKMTSGKDGSDSL